MDATLPVFATNTLRIACVSDTHNDNPFALIPNGDIFIHAGDMTDHATVAEFTAVLDWISALPHTVKIVVAGNRDASLDTESYKTARLRNPATDQPRNKFNPDAHRLLTSSLLKDKGIHYLDRETRTVAYYKNLDGSLQSLKIYGNPVQPEFSSGRYPFTYPPHPSQEAEEAWESAPEMADAIPIWVMHGPPLKILDDADVDGFKGCAVQARKIAEAKPMLCVFGHFHYSHGVEIVRWNEQADNIGETEVLSWSHERKRKEDLQSIPTRKSFDFSSIGGKDGSITRNVETLFVNAAWMTSRKTNVEARNMPILVTLSM